MQTQITTKCGKLVSVIHDDEDLSWVINNEWSMTINGYLAIRLTESKQLYMHRLVLKRITKDSFDVDHVNRNKLDNRKENLRLVSRSENNYNSAAKGGSSKYKGVYRNRVNNCYTANITHRYKNIYLLSDVSEDVAAYAYNVALKLISPAVACLNCVGALPLERSSEIEAKVRAKLKQHNIPIIEI